MSVDQTLTRIARHAVLVSVLFAAVAFAVGGGAAALGVAGGASLTLLSFLMLKRGTARLADASAPAVPKARVAALIVARYALLAFAAYVMIARLHLHPIGLLVGASSIVTAIAFEAAAVLSVAHRSKGRGVRAERGTGPREFSDGSS